MHPFHGMCKQVQQCGHPNTTSDAERNSTGVGFSKLLHEMEKTKWRLTVRHAFQRRVYSHISTQTSVVTNKIPTPQESCFICCL
jgi:hypothetical protein